MARLIMNNTQLTVIRTVATAAVTALATLQVLYPSYTWIAAATAALATLGIHAIPAIQQKGTIMTDGLTAMGLVPAEQTPPEQPQAVTEVPETPETAPVVTSSPEPVITAGIVGSLTGLQGTPDNSAARQALTDAANALLKIAESL